MRYEHRPVNGAPALWVRGPDGALLSIVMVQLDGGSVQTIANQLNPEKLGHLAPVGDLSALLRGAGGGWPAT